MNCSKSLSHLDMLVSCESPDLVHYENFIVDVNRQIVGLYNHVVFWVQMSWQSHLSIWSWIGLILLDVL
jgi:hypothetical protein